MAWYLLSTRTSVLLPLSLSLCLCNTLISWSSHSWDADSLSASHEILRLLWNPKVHYFAHKIPSPSHLISLRPIVILFSRWRNLYSFGPQFELWNGFTLFSTLLRVSVGKSWSAGTRVHKLLHVLCLSKSGTDLADVEIALNIGHDCFIIVSKGSVKEGISWLAEWPLASLLIGFIFVLSFLPYSSQDVDRTLQYEIWHKNQNWAWPLPFRSRQFRVAFCLILCPLTS